MDNMIQKLESYATNLEEIVEQRTGQLVEEKKKTEILLYRMLPKYAIYCLRILCFNYNCHLNYVDTFGLRCMSRFFSYIYSLYVICFYIAKEHIHLIILTYCIYALIQSNGCLIKSNSNSFRLLICHVIVF